MAHADGVAAILQGIGAAPSMRAAAYLVYAGDYLQRPEEVVSKAFGESYAGLVSHTRRLVQIQRSARDAQVEAQRRALQTERVRKMLLAFASDLRVVLLRLASRLQTLRWYAASRRECPAGAGARVAGRVRAAGQPAGHLADQVGAGGPGLPLPAGRRIPPRGRADGRQAAAARGGGGTGAPATGGTSWRPPACSARCRAGPSTCTACGRRCRARASTSPMSSTCARCASSSTTCRPAMRRWRACTTCMCRCRASSTTTSPSPSPTATSRCTPWCVGMTARRWKCRSAPARCTSMPNTAWPRTGPTRKPARAAMPASAPRATSRSAWPRRGGRCCASCWPGSARSPSAMPPRPKAACSTTASTSSRRRPR